MTDLTKERGMFELTLLNAEVSREQLDDVLVIGLNRGIPPEIMTRLESVWGMTRTIAGEVVAIGKIVVMKIFEFLKANPNLTIGIALGAAVGALISGIPFLGALLAPLVSALSVLYGAAVGAAKDEGADGSDPYAAVAHLAKKFFELIRAIFSSVKDCVLAE